VTAEDDGHSLSRLVQCVKKRPGRASENLP